MKLRELFENNDKAIFSFEVFPPKRDGDLDSIYKTLEELTLLEPSFISVTYGAGGNVRDHKTAEISSAIKNEFGLESCAHLTCVDSTKGDIRTLLDVLEDFGIENILALRGDVQPGNPPKEDFPHASDLISFIKESGHDFGISGACYPEGHPSSDTIDEDIKNLKTKVDAGAEHLVSQLFFDNNSFYQFIDKIRDAGIAVPVEAGIMPVINQKQIERMVSLCGASLPSKFTRMMSRYGNNPEAMRDAGIAYAVDQIVDLLANGVDGIHLYTMNNPSIAKKIAESIKSLL